MAELHGFEGRVRIDVMIHANRQYCESAPGTHVNDRVCVGAFWMERTSTLGEMLDRAEVDVRGLDPKWYPYLVVTPF